jgi:sugar lactone lactonase YvrE
MLKLNVLRRSVFGLGMLCFGVLVCDQLVARPVGFTKTTVELNAPPVGVAFDNDGVLFALEGAPFNSNVARLRKLLPSGMFDAGVTILGDDLDNFFVGSMTYDPVGERLLISDNTADGRLYAVDAAGNQQTIATGIPGIAGVAVRDSGEIFVSTAPFGSAGAVLQVDRTTSATTPVLEGLGFGAGLAFDPDGNLIVQDADSATFQGRLQRLPMVDGPGGLEIGTAEPILGGMQSGAGVTVDSEGGIFTTGNGGLYQLAGDPVVETAFDDNDSPSQFATAIAFNAGSTSFEAFSGPTGGQLAYMADFGFGNEDSFVTLLTPSKLGDYDGDGEVDSDDHSLWAQTFAEGAGQHADGNLDGTVDAADYVAWRKFAEGMGSAHSVAGAGSVPEPTVSWLAIVAWVIGCCGRRSGRGQRLRQNGAPS